MAELCGIDRVIFGSDWPHPEGLASRRIWSTTSQGLDEEGQRKVMGGNMIDLFKVPNEIVHKPDVPALVTRLTEVYAEAAANPEAAVRSTTQSFLEKEASLTRLRELHAAGTSFERGWWRRAAELGWTSLLVPEEHGGGSVSGDGVADLALVAELTGKTVARDRCTRSAPCSPDWSRRPKTTGTIESLVSGETRRVVGGL